MSIPRNKHDKGKEKNKPKREKSNEKGFSIDRIENYREVTENKSRNM